METIPNLKAYGYIPIRDAHEMQDEYGVVYAPSSFLSLVRQTIDDGRLTYSMLYQRIMELSAVERLLLGITATEGYPWKR